jgi:uncharacterized membrane protein
MNAKTIAIASIAGIACMLLIAAAGHAGIGGLVLLLLAPFPIYAAAFGWGTQVAILSSVVAIVLSGVFVSPLAGIATGLAFTIPASLVGHQANLAQPDENGNLVWYPLQGLFFNLCIVLAVSFAAILFYTGYDQLKSEAMPLVGVAVDEVIKQNPYFDQVGQQEIDSMKNATFDIMPFWISGLWLIVHVANAILAAFICRASNLMPRPRDDVPTSLSLPMPALGILIAAAIGTWISTGATQYYIGSFLGVFLTGFSLVGLAMLHLKARNSGAHFFLLMLSYALIFFIYLPLFIFSGTGIVRTLSQPKNTPPSADNKQT